MSWEEGLCLTSGLVHDSWSKDTNARIKDHLGASTHKGLLEKQEQREAQPRPCSAAPLPCAVCCSRCEPLRDACADRSPRLLFVGAQITECLTEQIIKAHCTRVHAGTWFGSSTSTAGPSQRRRTAAPGDAPTRKDGEKQPSAPGVLCCPAAKVPLGQGHPCRAAGRVPGEGTGASVTVGLQRIYGQRTNSHKRRGRENLRYCTGGEMHT